MSRPAVLASVALTLFLSHSAAAAASGPVFDGAPLHAGDLLVYERALLYEATDADGTTTRREGIDEVVIQVEGRTQVADATGFEREVDAFLVTVQRDGRVLEARRCYDEDHFPIRTDWLLGGPTERREYQLNSLPTGLPGPQTRRTDTVYATEFGGECRFDYTVTHDASEARYSGPALRYDIPGLLPPESPTFLLGASAPRISAGDFEGADSLTFDHALAGDGASGMLSLTIADGFPGAVRVELHRNLTRDNGERERVDVTFQLVGFRRGEGKLIERTDARTYPGPISAEHFASAHTLDVPDRILGLPYPFADALTAMRADPALGLDSWLFQHPDAYVLTAAYDRHMEEFMGTAPDGQAASSSDGGWYVGFVDATSSFDVISVQHTGLVGPTGTLALPQKAVTNYKLNTRDLPAAAAPAQHTLASEVHMARLLAVANIDITQIESFGYRVDFGEQRIAWATVSEVPLWSRPRSGTDEGRVAHLHLDAGVLNGVAIVRDSVIGDGFVGAIPTMREISPTRSQATPLSALQNPGFEAAAALTGLALLALAIKLLVPLYTRLRRDRLLDNPVRARLYDHVRSEPGIHLAELEEFLGVGKGATRHHVDQLARHHLVFLLDDGGFTRAYASGHVPRDVAQRAAILRAGSHARVYDLFAARPAISLREAARELGMAAPSVHRAKKKLENAGLLPAAPVADVAEA